MLRYRFLVLLGVCFLAASAAWADEVGYVDCSNHSDATQVFGKPRRSPDVVASLPCGERFTILVYGFYFSRIQTKDGQVGYIYSSLIAIDRGATASQQTPSLQSAAEKTKIPSTRTSDAKPALPSLPQSQPAPAQPVAAPTIISPAPASSTSVSPSSVTPAPASAVTGAPGTPVAQPDPPAGAQPAPAQLQPTPAQPAFAPTPEIAPPVATPTPSESPAPVAQPEPAANAPQPDPPAQPAPEPQPAPAQPAPAIRPADTHETWERPNPSVRTAPLIELYGGYGFTRVVSGGSSTNFNGALGSFGWNFKPWLQIVGDSSYSFVTVGGTKNVLYGNHYGPRFFYRAPNRWRLTPFAEALVGGSRADTTVSGTGGYTASQNSLSYKVGGGVDFHPSHRWEIRLFDFDYYRTSFGTNAHQNNYSASTGIVLRLFGGRSE
jgi:hypothetical protein